MTKLFFYKIYDFFCGKTTKRKKLEAEFGELFVTGKNETEINLSQLPKIIEVKFKDNSISIPCNNHTDKVKYEVTRHHHEYKLIIKWDVVELREIVWVIYF